MAWSLMRFKAAIVEALLSITRHSSLKLEVKGILKTGSQSSASQYLVDRN